MDQAPKDKYKAVWVSHSAISDFQKCPRTYFLRHFYKDPRTGRRMTLMTPPLALGQVVHDVIDSISTLPASDRLKVSLVKRYEVSWANVEGKKGGFKSHGEEMEYKERGAKMLKRIEENPGPILNKAVKIDPKEDPMPNYWFSVEDNIILNGKIDWIEYLDKDNSIHLIDFKTGKGEEGEESLQLPIYYLLASNTQPRQVSKVSYWYLDKDGGLSKKNLPDKDKSYEDILNVARRIKLARQINHFICPNKGCPSCRPLERIFKGEGERINVVDNWQDVYILKD